MMNLFENLQAMNEDDTIEHINKEEIEQLVLNGFETGHMPYKNLDDFEQDFPYEDYGYGHVIDAYNYYEEMVNMGPAGFYEEYSDKLDFSDSYKAEYGYDELDENKSLKESQELYKLPDETQIAILSDFDFDKPIYQADGTDGIQFAIESAIWQAIKSININDEELVINISKRNKTPIDDEGNII